MARTRRPATLPVFRKPSPALLCLLLFVPWPCSAAVFEHSSIVPPPPLREFRAAWVATVLNIDWPSANNLSTAQQKQELVALLDCARQLRLNAIIFQVRPACDAFYASELEPWSEYLTGTMGRAPVPFYDPLAFAVEEAHRRALELHAWFNPYRARHSSAASPASSSHISKTHPGWVRRYGKSLWLDPGEREAQSYLLNVVMDVVKRYDIDGVQFDDYFYPYRERDSAGREIDFPDEAAWQRYGAAGALSRDDWRRENINSFIQRGYQAIKSQKPSVKFGVSPFGIWRPGVPASIDSEALDAYAKLYADSRKWLANGWLDYLAPQLYWPIEPKEHSFPVLLNWWAQQNLKQRNLFPGLDLTKIAGSPDSARTSKTKPSLPVNEIVNQIQLTRKQTGAGGQIFWNMKCLLENNALAVALERRVYQQTALVPRAPWLGRTMFAKPNLVVSNEKALGTAATWSPGGPDKPWLWLLQTRSAGEWKSEVLPAGKNSQRWTGPSPEVVALSPVDRNGNIGPAAVLERK